MGGSQDATNVLAKPEICVFAQISMDHMQFLGDTLTKIATEKAGIIKPYTTVISAPQVPEVSKVLREICEVQHASYIEVNPSDWEVVQMNLDGTLKPVAPSASATFTKSTESSKIVFE